MKEILLAFMLFALLLLPGCLQQPPSPQATPTPESFPAQTQPASTEDAAPKTPPAIPE